MSASWGMDIVRGMFSFIDSAIYSLISIVYEILINISKVEIFGPNAINDMATKIYTLLGIFMLFKVTFSFITYLVDPDQITDKSKGAQKIILNILVVLLLIIITPTAFSKLREAQTAILKDEIISKFIFNDKDIYTGERTYQMSKNCGENISQAKTDGDFLALLIFRPFFQVYESIDIINPTNNYCQIGVVGDVGYATVSRYLKFAPMRVSRPAMPILNPAEGEYAIDYKAFLSTITGIVVLLILVSFCFDVAVRAIKLGFLQIIAPIPIISYVDPKSGKDGMFKKWLKEVGRTWVDLFIRLTALFFAIYIIKYISIGDIYEEVEEYKFWVMLFIIIGALMFAKKLPKLLEDLLGIKLDSGLTLNPMKKIRDNALGGKMITGALKGTAALGAGFALGTGANFAALMSNKEDLKKNLTGENGVKGFVRGLGKVAGVGVGGISTGLHGAYGTYKDDSIKKGLMPGLKKSVDNRDLRDKRQKAEYGLRTRMTDSLKGIAGIKTEATKNAIAIGDNIAAHQATQAGLYDQWKALMPKLTADQTNMISTVSVSDGKYSFLDKDNKQLEWNGRTKFSEDELTSLLESGLFGTFQDTYKDEDVFEDKMVTNYVNGEWIQSKQRVKTGTKKVLVSRGSDDGLEAIKIQTGIKKEAKTISDLQKTQGVFQKEAANKEKKS